MKFARSLPSFIYCFDTVFSVFLSVMAASSKHSPGNDNVSRSVKEPSHSISWMRSFFLSTHLDVKIRNHKYVGKGTGQDPYIVDYLPNDRQDAMSISKGRKWAVAVPQTLSFFAVTFASSVYASGIPEIMQRFQVSNEVATLGLALYVLGFAVGPVIWAPMSEVYGRRLTFMVSYTVYIAFTVAAPFAPNIAALLILRFFASAFGSSAQTNPGGMISDMFSKEERGLIMGLFAASPFLGPALGMLWNCFCFDTARNNFLGIPADTVQGLLSAVSLQKQKDGAGSSG